MKRLLYFLFAMMLLCDMSACVEKNEDYFDETLLYGRWQEGTVFERYDDTGWGATWDVGDDVNEEEAQPFQWRLEGAKLIHEHIGTFVTVPKVYTINTLDASQLTYSDEYGNTHYYTKVE